MIKSKIPKIYLFKKDLLNFKSHDTQFKKIFSLLQSFIYK